MAGSLNYLALLYKSQGNYGKVEPTEIRKRAIALLEQLPGESLVRAVEFLEALSHEALQVSIISKASEAALLEIIQHRLSPEEQQKLAYLRQQNEAGVITDTEHQELLIFVERVEQQDSALLECSILTRSFA